VKKTDVAPKGQDPVEKVTRPSDGTPVARVDDGRDPAGSAAAVRAVSLTFADEPPTVFRP